MVLQIDRQIPQMNRTHHPGKKLTLIQSIDFQERDQCNTKGKEKYLQQIRLEKLNKRNGKN